MRRRGRHTGGVVLIALYFLLLMPLLTKASVLETVIDVSNSRGRATEGISLIVPLLPTIPGLQVREWVKVNASWREELKDGKPVMKIELDGLLPGERRTIRIQQAVDLQSNRFYPISSRLLKQAWAGIEYQGYQARSTVVEPDTVRAGDCTEVAEATWAAIKKESMDGHLAFGVAISQKAGKRPVLTPHDWVTVNDDGGRYHLDASARLLPEEVTGYIALAFVGAGRQRQPYLQLNNRDITTSLRFQLAY